MVYGFPWIFFVFVELLFFSSTLSSTFLTGLSIDFSSIFLSEVLTGFSIRFTFVGAKKMSLFDVELRSTIVSNCFSIFSISLWIVCIVVSALFVWTSFICSVCVMVNTVSCNVLCFNSSNRINSSIDLLDKCNILVGIVTDCCLFFNSSEK